MGIFPSHHVGEAPMSILPVSNIVVMGLPGAEFSSAAALVDWLDVATDYQRIRHEYVKTGDVDTLWNELLARDFTSANIRDIIVNPSTLTNVVYFAAADIL
jgi:hypothetical protein